MSARLPLKDHIFISEFAAYARGRGEDEYCYLDTEDCACGQFLRETGRIGDAGGVGGTFWDNGDGDFHDFPDGLSSALVRKPHNFASLATRLESLLSDMKVEVGK